MAGEITPTSQVDSKEIIILTHDRSYCVDCQYLIGIVTHEQKAKFSLLVNSIDAEKNNTHLLKLGEIKTIKFQARDEQKAF